MILNFEGRNAVIGPTGGVDKKGSASQCRLFTLFTVVDKLGNFGSRSNSEISIQ